LTIIACISAGVLVTKADTPFEPFSDNFQVVLIRGYLCPVAKWLFGAGPDRLLAQESNSAWEAALSVIYLLRFADILKRSGISDADAPALDSIERKCLQTADWLCSIARHVSDDELSWENVTWDTATVIRAFFIIKQHFGDTLPERQRSSIDAAIKKGLLWLLRRFAIWHRTVKYPFGPADIASIAVCLAEGRRNFPKTVNDVCKAALGDEKGSDHLWIRALRDISEYLLLQATTPKDAIDPEGLQHLGPCWWDDFFTTSEALEALGEYVLAAQNTAKEQKEHGALVEQVRRALISAACFFERCQVDGMWGSHIDTIKVLYIYIKLPTYLAGANKRDGLISNEMHVAFKAVRWICDSKQFFSDGSILHTMFLTIFAAHTLLQIADNWPPALKQISDLYDDVVWAAPVRVSAEKIERTRIALELERVSRDRDHEKTYFENELQDSSYEIGSARAQNRTILLTIAWIILGCSIAILFDVVEINTAFKMKSANDLFAFLGVMVTSYIGLVTFIWRQRNQPKKGRSQRAIKGEMI
jgi:hypothetical protein